MKKIILSCILTVISIVSFGQGTVKGVIRDTASFRNMPFVSVALIDQADSTLVQATRTADKGDFEFKNLAAGKYILLASQNLYVDYVDQFTLSEGGTKDFGTIAFTQLA